ncbi:MAG: sigma-70 family RNA polymerase sigma factor [Armatimonadetes bacterium]|nr:sigma-70 family RNA polymerase sigma factor [Armatimonadota bacterium]
MNTPESQLVIRAQSGDQQAFAELMRRYSDRVFRLAVSVLGKEFVPEAEDIAQEVFLKAFDALSQFRADSQFGTWLYRITFNKAVNLKSRFRYRRPHVGSEALAHVAIDREGPAEQVENSERDEVIAECIAQLPDAYQSALRLHYWMGYGLAEIGEMLEMPENTVKSHLYRSRQLLNSMLRGRGYADE